ncbi:hypothetical protein [uncultured Tateyamaria sp.]|uniref:hypothetical protein n=1 Tax=uncultured Tateyamaria sp. TaxID=455651 RepID=UPI0026177177|nr:hypothetical protein [uncultured Tateyamaria sp.]
MYNGDSFYTLTMWGQIGLACVSLLFAALALGFTRLLVLRRPLIMRVPVWIVAFITFVWASPQGYYTYYRMIFDGLPAQSVIKAPPPPQELVALLTFTGPATLSAHSTGVLGWLMFAVAIWPQRRKCRDAAH